MRKTTNVLNLSNATITIGGNGQANYNVSGLTLKEFSVTPYTRQ